MHVVLKVKQVNDFRFHGKQELYWDLYLSFFNF